MSSIKLTPPIKSENICYECGEKEFDEIFTNGYKLCKNCAEEICSRCVKCGTLYLDTGNISINIDMCPTCYDMSVKCPDCHYVVNQDHQCELCNAYLCDMHKDNHHCVGTTPRHRVRSYVSYPVIGKKELAKKIKDDRLVGVELECVNGDPDKLALLLRPIIGIAHDGSLRGNNPVELITPPASADQIEALIENITYSAKKSGYGVNKTCSVHVHFGSEDFRQDSNLIFRIIMTYYAVEPMLFAMLPPSRQSNRYALPLHDWLDASVLINASHNLSLATLEDMWYKTHNVEYIEDCKHHKWDSSRYFGFNLHALFSQGHLELRHHHGSLNPNKIKNWIMLNLAFINWAISDDYSVGIVNAIINAKTPWDKLRIIYRHMPIDIYIRRYIKRGLTKFSNK